jgi:hypothetical protein
VWEQFTGRLRSVRCRFICKCSKRPHSSSKPSRKSGPGEASRLAIIVRSTKRGACRESAHAM